MKPLNLPPFGYNMRKNAGKVEIFDIIRKKYVVITPEEWVRQHFIHFLIDELKYPKSLFKVESGLKYNKLSKRSDILIYNREGVPWMLIECKSYDIKISQKGFNQLSVYNSQIKAKYLILTNGLQHYCCFYHEETKAYKFLESIPEF